MLELHSTGISVLKQAVTVNTATCYTTVYSADVWCRCAPWCKVLQDHHLLVPPLHRAVPLVQVHHIAVVICQDLNLNVAGVLHISLNEHSAGSMCRHEELRLASLQLLEPACVCTHAASP